MGQTRVLLHSHMGWRRLTAGTYLLGRSKDCDIVIPSNRASRRHARLTVTESAAWVEDLGSANGTHVNGIPIKGRQELHHQDFLGVGAGALEVSLEPDEGAPRAEVLRPRSTVPPPQDATNEATIGASDDEGPEHAIEGWADGALTAARAGQLDDGRTRRSAMQFGVQRASGRPAARWVDFVVELASLGIALELERARALTTAIEQVGVDATLTDAYLARLRALPPSPEQQALCAEVEGWLSKARRG
jgi:pSer/pThr/pTyr-binding forkhead associated (FHA) protein